MDNEFCRLLFGALNPEERIFKFRSAEVTGKVLTVVFMVRGAEYDTVLTDRLRDKVKSIGQSLLPTDVTLNVEFRKITADERMVVNKVLEYVFREHKSVYPAFSEAEYGYEADGAFAVLTIKTEKHICEYAKSIDMANRIREMLDGEFVEETEVAFMEKPDKETSGITPARIYSGEIRLIDAKPTRILVKGNFDYPRYIADVNEKEREENNLTICGVISGIRTRRLPPKTERSREKILFSFILNDTTGKIKCKFFATVRENTDWEQEIADGGRYIMNGSYKYDSFDNKYVFIANSLAEAEIDFESINVKTNFNFDYGRYINISPEPYTAIAQNDLFDASDDSDGFFIGKTFVVFDLETTGKDVETDEIVEIAGVKIVDGLFSEKFVTFVHPSIPIPKDATNVNHITDEMVEFAPLLGEVIPDFYRFCKGCTLVGHNIIGYDIPLLNNQAAKVKYEFDNPAIDTLILSRQKLRLAHYHLSNVCKALNVPLIDAHRALNDVTANAQVFIKLMKMR